MAKTISGTEVESAGMEYGVEYDVNGETFVTYAEDEEDARLRCAVLRGKLVCREIFFTSWADAA